MKVDPGSGKPFFIDHKTRTTSWEDPRTQKAYAVSLSIPWHARPLSEVAFIFTVTRWAPKREKLLISRLIDLSLINALTTRTVIENKLIERNRCT